MRSLGINVDAVQACVTNSFNKTGPFNFILDAELRLKEELNLIRLPSIVVQDVILRGGATVLRHENGGGGGPRRGVPDSHAGDSHRRVSSLLSYAAGGTHNRALPPCAVPPQARRLKLC